MCEQVEMDTWSEMSWTRSSSSEPDSVAQVTHGTGRPHHGDVEEASKNDEPPTE